jgi:hypothetical protein
MKINLEKNKINLVEGYVTVEPDSKAIVLNGNEKLDMIN